MARSYTFLVSFDEPVEGFTSPVSKWGQSIIAYCGGINQCLLVQLCTCAGCDSGAAADGMAEPAGAGFEGGNEIEPGPDFAQQGVAGRHGQEEEASDG